MKDKRIAELEAYLKNHSPCIECEHDAYCDEVPADLPHRANCEVLKEWKQILEAK